MANLWREFKDLFPDETYAIGTITAVNSSNRTVTLDLISGETLTVKGEGVSVGNKVLVERGVVVQTLPNLSLYNVSIY